MLKCSDFVERTKTTSDRIWLKEQKRQYCFQPPVKKVHVLEKWKLLRLDSDMNKYVCIYTQELKMKKEFLLN